MGWIDSVFRFQSLFIRFWFWYFWVSKFYFLFKLCPTLRTLTCEHVICANIVTWHVIGDKQSLRSGVNGWFWFGVCFCPPRMVKSVVPMLVSGNPPERFAQPPKLIRCNRLRPPATPPFPAKLYWYTCNVKTIAGSELLGSLVANAESKNNAARSAVGALNSVGPPKKSSRKYTLGESSESIRRKENIQEKRKIKKEKCKS